MKKALAVFVPLLFAGLIILLGFRIGSPVQKAADPPETPLLDELAGQETISLPEPFASVGSPGKEEAQTFLLQMDAPGYTVLDCGDLYGSMPGVHVYGFFAGEDLEEDAVWNDDAMLEVFLFADEEEAETENDTSLDSVILFLYPRGCGEEECERLIDFAEAILRFSTPGMTDEEFDALLATDAYTRLLECCYSYADPEAATQAGTSVNEVFVAGEESLSLISHEAYRYVEICLRTPAPGA